MASNTESLLNHGSWKGSVTGGDYSLCCAAPKNAASLATDPSVASVTGINTSHPFSFLIFFSGISFNLDSQLFPPFILILKFSCFNTKWEHNPCKFYLPLKSA